ncbi:WecB/TagA/CpsF family glycosyltransferase [Aestuariibacter sp. GS-14]|uniref:WecB/TagA/CpsF family glycosyltransferase n=1 Tax=Aestuariibacter sp. GS-14 TaxID=2590670 RepID=UPI00112695E7|nr:WecB/TagA/CpsF family glycosyltransferase [Aestuariibacter sp. GS-14]TPV53848.1 WecB/TagA/CpsF family glycosyltransferase [Aestuariibacter sp. GS-14]
MNISNYKKLNIFDLFIFNSNKMVFYSLIRTLACSGKPAVIVTPNVDHYVRISKSTTIKELYSSADFCINDSRVMAILVKVILNKNISVITGSDITSMILRRGDFTSFKILIVGAPDPMFSQIHQGLNSMNTNISHVCPSFGFIDKPDEVDSISDIIVQENADILFLALGSPQQEFLAHFIKPRLKKGIILCVGASIDYLTGKEKRAPKFIQAMYLEWLFRFAQSPIKRFRRYFINCPQIIYYLLRERFLSK